MISDGASTGWQAAGWDALATLTAVDGSAVHPHVARLLTARAAQRDLADAVHAICAVHGSTSERLHEAAGQPVGAGYRDWLSGAATGFAAERTYLAAIVSAAGPLPSTPGQAQTEQAFAAARHALHTLVISDRQGCMLGAAAALLLDWRTIRVLLDHAAMRFGVAPAPVVLPGDRETAAVIGVAAATPAAERALAFGAQQLLAQQRALWDLLETRAGARAGD